MEKKHLHDFIFHYNSYTDKWDAAPRDYYEELFNGNKGHVISSSSIETLKYLIIKYKGDIAVLNKDFPVPKPRGPRSLVTTYKPSR